MKKTAAQQLDKLLKECNVRVCLCFTCKHQADRVCALCGCRNDHRPYNGSLPAHLL